MKAKRKTRANPKTIDEYLAALSHDKRAALERLRRVIHAAAPGAEECISYGIPAFRLGGKCLVWMGAAANHCAIYGVVGIDKREPKGYDTRGRGTIRFPADHPLPTALVRKLVKARIAKIAARQPRRAQRAGAEREGASPRRRSALVAVCGD